MARREGKKLPDGLLDKIAAELSINRWEIQKRVQFAAIFSTENQLCDGVTQWPTWHQMTQEDNGNAKRPKLWSIADLCEYFGCTPTTLYQWLKKGYLPPPHKRFGHKRWAIEEVDEWVKKLAKDKR